MQPRDMFDIAAVARSHGTNYLVAELVDFEDEVRAALATAEGYRPRAVQAVLANLNIRTEFEDLRDGAHQVTIELLRQTLETACSPKGP